MARYIPDASKAEEMKKDLQQKVIDLAENFKQNPQDIADYLIFSSQFYNYSSRNSMLIRSQNPGAILCNSYKQYQNMGLQIKKGEHGMKILVPTYKTYLKIDGDLVSLSNATAEQKKAYKENKIESTQKLFFKVGTVFDISQTNCPVKDYPKYLDLGYKSEQHAQIYNTMKNFCEQQLNCPVHENAFSSVNMRGYYEPNTNSISLSGNFEDTTRLSILSHELAHAVLHNDVKLERPTEQMEFEADATSVMLQSYFGIEVAESRLRHLSDSYNKMLSNKDITSKDVIQSLDRAHQAYKQVVTAVNSELKPELQEKEIQGKQKQKQSQPAKLNELISSSISNNQTPSDNLQSIHKFYDDVDLLAKYEEKHNVPTNERLTEWFGDYGMNVPKKNITPEIVEQRLNQFQTPDVNSSVTQVIKNKILMQEKVNYALNDPTNVKYEHCEFREINFSNTNGKILQANNCRFYDCKFNDCNFIGTDFGGSVFTDCDIYNSNFSAANLNGSGIYYTRFFNSNFTNSEFCDSSIRHCSFNESTFSSTNVGNASMDSVYFRNTTIKQPVKNLDKLNITMGGATPEEVANHKRQILKQLNSSQGNPNDVPNTNYNPQSNSQSVQTQTPAAIPQQPILPCQLPDMGMGGMNFGM